jgi:hypothetical protein
MALRSVRLPGLAHLWLRPRHHRLRHRTSLSHSHVGTMTNVCPVLCSRHQTFSYGWASLRRLRLGLSYHSCCSERSPPTSSSAFLLVCLPDYITPHHDTHATLFHYRLHRPPSFCPRRVHDLLPRRWSPDRRPIATLDLRRPLRRRDGHRHARHAGSIVSVRDCAPLDPGPVDESATVFPRGGCSIAKSD